VSNSLGHPWQVPGTFTRIFPTFNCSNTFAVGHTTLFGHFALAEDPQPPLKNGSLLVGKWNVTFYASVSVKRPIDKDPITILPDMCVEFTEDSIITLAGKEKTITQYVAKNMKMAPLISILCMTRKTSCAVLP
jgi:hypothetical protein